MKSKKIRWSLQLSAIVMCIILLACFPMPALVSAQSKVDVLFEGTVNLPLSETFTVTTYNSGADRGQNTPSKRILRLGHFRKRQIPLASPMRSQIRSTLTLEYSFWTM